MKTIADLGAEFQALRNNAGLTQQEVAHRVGLRQEALSRFERGRGNEFRVGKLLQLAQTLGFDLYFASAKKPPTLDDLYAERVGESGYPGYSGSPAPSGHSGYSGVSPAKPSEAARPARRKKP